MTLALRACPYCRTESAPAFSFDDERMVVCGTCGAWFVWPSPSVETMHRQYGDRHPGVPEELRRWRMGTAQPRSYQRVARDVARSLADAPSEKVRSIADVGAGGLQLAMALAAQFPAAHIEAWDYYSADDTNSVLPNELRGRISLRSVDLNEDGQSFAGSFDLVICFAVIEHVLDPIALLERINLILAPGGVAYLVGPDVGAHARRVMRRSWPYYCPDEHVTLPTLASMEKAMSLARIDEYRLRRISVYYSTKYLARFLRLPFDLPSALDFVVPIPAGALELTWRKVTGQESASRSFESLL